MKKLLITGFTGFVGSKVTKLLLEKGYEIVTLSRFKMGNLSQERGKHMNITKDLSKSILDWNSDLLKDIKIIIHLAADFDSDDYVNNKQMGLNLIKGISDSVEGIIFASTSYVYSPANSLIVEDDLLEPQNNYARAKLELENKLRQLSFTNKFKLFNLRISNIYGPNNQHKNLIANFFDSKIKDKLFNLNGEINLKRDYIYVDDVVDVILSIVINIDSINKDGNYNISTGNGFSPLEIAKLLTSDSKIAISNKSNVTANISSLVLSNQKAKDILNFTPKVNFRDGLIDNFTHYKSMR